MLARLIFAIVYIQSMLALLGYTMLKEFFEQ